MDLVFTDNLDSLAQRFSPMEHIVVLPSKDCCKYADPLNFKVVYFNEYFDYSNFVFEESYSLIEGHFNKVQHINNFSDFIFSIKPEMLLFGISDYLQYKTAVRKILDQFNPKNIFCFKMSSFGKTKANFHFNLVKVILYDEAFKRGIIKRSKILFFIQSFMVFFYYYIGGIIQSVSQSFTIKERYQHLEGKSNSALIFSHGLPHSIIARSLIESIQSSFLFTPILIEKNYHLKDFVIKNHFFSEEQEKIPFYNLPKFLLYSFKLFQSIISLHLSKHQKDKLLNYFITLFCIKYIKRYLTYYFHYQITFDKIKPVIMVNFEDRSMYHRLSYIFANKYDIPSILVQCGLYGDHPLYRYEFPCSKFCVEGMKIKEIFIKMGVPEFKIQVTGQPKYEFLKRNSQIQNLEFKDFSSRFVILFCSTNFEENVESNTNIEFVKRELELLLCKLEGQSKYYLIIKPHYAQRLEWFKGVLAGFSSSINFHLLLPNENVYNFIPKANLVITRFSTIGIEVLSTGNLLMILTEKHNSRNIYTEYGVAGIIDFETDIDEQINHYIIFSKTRKYRSSVSKFLLDYANGIDGNACKNILDTMKEIS